MCKYGYYVLSVNIRWEKKACGSLGTVLLGNTEDADCPALQRALKVPPVVV